MRRERQILSGLALVAFLTLGQGLPSSAAQEGDEQIILDEDYYEPPPLGPLIPVEPAWPASKPDCYDVDGLEEPPNRTIVVEPFGIPRGDFITNNPYLQQWRDGIQHVFIRRYFEPQQALILDSFDTDLPDSTAQPNFQAGIRSGDTIAYATSLVTEINGIVSEWAITKETIDFPCTDGRVGYFYSSPRFVQIAPPENPAPHTNIFWPR